MFKKKIHYFSSGLITYNFLDFTSFKANRMRPPNINYHKQIDLALVKKYIYNIKVSLL